MDKKIYIMNQLSRTNKKNYENYCITRIIHKLDDLSIKFITQQLFRRENGIALADLYFPQFNLIVEVDEAHHDKSKDDERTDEIIKNKISAFEEVINFDLEVQRIDVTQEIEEINRSADAIVALILQKKTEIGSKFLAWNDIFHKPQYYIDKGFLDLKEAPSFATIQEVSELFNKQYGSKKQISEEDNFEGKRRGHSGTQKSWFRVSPGSNIYVWCPKLILNGQDYHVPYLNEISMDGNTIFESARSKNENKKFIDDVIHGDQKDLTTRYVFAYYKDSSGANRYRYRGIFELNKVRTIEEKKRVWERNQDIEILSLKSYFN